MVVRNKKYLAVVMLALLIITLNVGPARAAWIRGPYPYSSSINAIAEYNGIWAAGGGGHMAYWDGTWTGKGIWPAGSGEDIYAMTIGLDGAVWIAGQGGYVARYINNTWEDLGRWVNGTFYIYAMTTSTSGVIWAAGISGYTARWTGNAWEDMGQPFGNDIKAIAESPDGTIWAAGISGYTARWNGSSWENLGQWPHGGNSIRGITISNDGSVWIGGYGGYTARWNGSSWIDMGQCLGGNDIYSLTTAPDGTIWAAGENGYVARHLNNAWEELGHATGFVNIYDILAASDGSIWICGNLGEVAQWLELSAPVLSIQKDGDNAILTWTTSINATSYILERSINGTNWNQVIETSQNTYTDQNLSAGTYYYRVKAKTGNITSEYSNVVSITIEPPPDPPVISVMLDGDNANLTWTTVAGATSYNLEKSTDGTNYTSIYQDSGNAYIDPSLAPGTYYYRVTTTVSGYFLASNVVSVTIEPPPSPRLWVYWPEGGQYVKVEWQSNGLDLSGDMVQLWREDTVTGIRVPVKEISESEKDAFEWTDTNVTASINYKYQIRVYDPATWEWRIAAESDWAALDRPFPAPGGLRVTSSTDTTATVTWTPVSGATTYQVQTSTDGGSTWQNSTAGGPPVTVPRPSMVRVKAGTHARSQWSGIIRVN